MFSVVAACNGLIPSTIITTFKQTYKSKIHTLDPHNIHLWANKNIAIIGLLDYRHNRETHTLADARVCAAETTSLLAVTIEPHTENH